MSKALVLNISYELPFPLISKLILISPASTGFVDTIGLKPENKRIGASIRMIKPNAKQKPYKIFSDIGFLPNSL